MRSFKRGSILLLALAALAAVGVPNAAAVEFHFESETTKISGSQEGVSTYTMTAGELTCETATYTGVATSKTQSSFKLAGTVSGCHLIVFGSTIAATINQNGCEGVIYANSEGELVCPEGKSVVVTAPGCTITIPPQKKTGGEIVNKGNHFHMSGTATGIKYTHSGFTCGFGSGSNGTISGETTVITTDTSGKEVKSWIE
ncbi:MAG TPA: hypothetical protein VFU11_09535 [Solirubrobacterales bacterium]|nr:hypothetical protein [Solirubrobacterales bacterium]